MKALKALSTSVGSKFLVALTGLALVGFLIGHLGGNLLILLGPDKFNNYSHALISNPLVIPAELGLIALLLLHVFKAVQHVVRGKTARPQSYSKQVWAGGPSRKSIGSATIGQSSRRGRIRGFSTAPGSLHTPYVPIPGAHGTTC